MRVNILVNGSYGDYNFCKDIRECDFIICADNGLKHAKLLDIKPDFIIGDFDSLEGYILDDYKKLGIKVQTLNPIKDKTDTECALDYAINLKATKVIIYGGIGSRFDHSLANVHLLEKLHCSEIKGEIRNENNTIYLVDNKIILDGNKNDIVSLLPFTEKVQGVYTSGLFYEVSDGTFELGRPYGVSNYMTQNKAIIKVGTGKLLVIKSRD